MTTNEWRSMYEIRSGKRSVRGGTPAAAVVHLVMLWGCSGAGHQVRTPTPASSLVEYRYERPPQLNDDLVTAAARDVGRRHEPLDELTAAIRRGTEYRDIHALLIAKDNRLVYEEYFAGEDEHGRLGALGRVAFDRDTRHDLRSVTKSIVSALVGIAVGSGAIRNVDDPLLDYFPEYSNVAKQEWRAITIRHALTMSAGLQWDEASPSGGGSSNTMGLMNRSPDLIRFTFERPVIHTPGTRWNYNGGLTQLLGEVVQRATGKPIVEYAREVLFAPLGIADFEWMPNAGRASTDVDSGLRLRARDLAKLGLLYAQGGRWHDRQIIPADWIAASLDRSVALPDSVVEYGNDSSGEVGYGYQWWHARFVMPYGQFTAHRAMGNGGQTVLVSPELGLMAVVFAGRYDQGNDVTRLILERIAPWAAGVDSTYRFWSERVVRRIRPGDWRTVALTAAERNRYVGVYDHAGLTVRVWEDAGVLNITPLPGMEGGPVHLVPKGDHVFAFGLYEGGQLTKIYWPDGFVEFELSGDRASRYLDRTVGGNVLTRAERVR
jgi:CubicO group peptidase (beta-lactamase class C family)